MNTLFVPVQRTLCQSCNTGLFTPFLQRSGMSRLFSSYIVTPQAAADALDQKHSSTGSDAAQTIPICAAWFLPNDPQGRTGRQVFEQRRIPNARFFDLDAVSDRSSSFPHMLPSPQTFAEAMTALGVTRADRLIVYDSYELGLFSAPRVAWTLRVFGHPHVQLLNNFRLWVDQGLPTESGPVSSIARRSEPYPVPTLDQELVVSFEQVENLVKDQNFNRPAVQIVDARSAGRFTGAEPEPRPGLSSGHMPGSINLPLPEILDPQTKALRSPAELAALFQEKGISADKRIISTCGSGVMAAALATAFQEAGLDPDRKGQVYDGSWTEYAQRAANKQGLIEKSA